MNKKTLILLLSIFLFNEAQARIDNPIIFKGEQALGTTSGAPLSTDANNQVTSGISNSETASTTAFTCNTTATQITGMTVTPVAGTYLAIYSSDFNSATSGVVVTLIYDVGGTGFTNSQRKFMPFAGGTLTAGSQRVEAGIHGIITVNGSQAVQVICSTSSNSVTTANSQLDLLRVQ